MERIDVQMKPDYVKIKTDLKHLDGISVIDVDAYWFFETKDVDVILILF